MADDDLAQIVAKRPEQIGSVKIMMQYYYLYWGLAAKLDVADPGDLGYSYVSSAEFKEGA